MGYLYYIVLILLSCSLLCHIIYIVPGLLMVSSGPKCIKGPFPSNRTDVVGCTQINFAPFLMKWYDFIYMHRHTDRMHHNNYSSSVVFNGYHLFPEWIGVGIVLFSSAHPVFFNVRQRADSLVGLNLKCMLLAFNVIQNYCGTWIKSSIFDFLYNGLG